MPRKTKLPSTTHPAKPLLRPQTRAFCLRCARRLAIEPDIVCCPRKKGKGCRRCREKKRPCTKVPSRYHRLLRHIQSTAALAAHPATKSHGKRVLQRMLKVRVHRFREKVERWRLAEQAAMRRTNKAAARDEQMSEFREEVMGGMFGIEEELRMSAGGSEYREHMQEMDSRVMRVAILGERPVVAVEAGIKGLGPAAA